MPRTVQPARLWLRPARGGHAAAWLILDQGRQFSTGCGADARGEAEGKLAEYLASKRDPASAGTRRTDRTPIADVLSVYLDEVVPKLTRPAKVAERIERLVDWWGAKPLSDVNAAACRAYESARTRGGARRDLEDLRAAINHHAKRGLHLGHIEVTLPRKGKPRSKYLTRDEVAKLLWVCWRHKRVQKPPRGLRKGQRVEGQTFYDLRHLARFILLGIYTGSRSTPLLRASIYRGSGRAFLDLNAGLYHRLPEDMEEAGNKLSPTARLGDRITAHVRRWRDKGAIAQYVVEWNGRPVKSVKTAWKQAVRLAGIEGSPTPHTLRHSAVTWLKQAGHSSFDVAGFAGMSEQMVERVYGKHDPDFQRAVANGFRRPTKRPERVSLAKSLALHDEENVTPIQLIEIVGGPGRTRTCNQTVMSGRL